MRHHERHPDPRPETDFPRLDVMFADIAHACGATQVLTYTTEQFQLTEKREIYDSLRKSKVTLSYIGPEPDQRAEFQADLCEMPSLIEATYKVTTSLSQNSTTESIAKSQIADALYTITPGYKNREELLDVIEQDEPASLDSFITEMLDTIAYESEDTVTTVRVENGDDIHTNYTLVKMTRAGEFKGYKLIKQTEDAKRQSWGPNPEEEWEYNLDESNKYDGEDTRRDAEQMKRGLSYVKLIHEYITKDKQTF